MDQPPDPSLRYEILVAALGEVIFEAPYGVRPVDLHSYGDAAVFNVRSPLAVGSLLRRVLNRDQEGQTPIQPEHPAITKLKAKLCPQAARHGVGEQRAGGGASGSSAAALHECEATYRASDNDREARKQSASTLLQAALGKAAFRVYVEAENDAQMKALAGMTQETFAEGLLSADLIPGQALRPIVRTAFTLSLEDIPQGFGVVNRVVELVKGSMRVYLARKYKDGTPEAQVSILLRQAIEHSSTESMRLLDAIRIGYVGISLKHTRPAANPRAAVNELRKAKSIPIPAVQQPPFHMSTASQTVQLDSTGSCNYRPIFGSSQHDPTADDDLKEFIQEWYDCIHGTDQGILQFWMAAKSAMGVVPFEDLRFSFLQAEYRFLVGMATARFRNDRRLGEIYTLMPAAGSAAQRRLSSVLQDFASDVKAYQTQHQHVVEVAAQVQRHLAASASDEGTAGATTDMSSGIRPVSTLQVPGGAPSSKKQRTQLPDGTGGMVAEAYLEDEESVCWKHLSTGGCSHASCPFLHIDRAGMGYKLSPQQESLLKRRVQETHHVEWDWGKIRSFELDEDIFN